MNRPPIDTGMLVKNVNREPIVSQSFPKAAHRFETDEYKSKVALEATGNPCREHLGAAQLKAQEKLADCRRRLRHDTPSRSNPCGSQ